MIGQFARKAEPSPDQRMRKFFLTRLERLVQLASPPGASFDAERLRRHAIYATFVDCRELGMEGEARQVLSSCVGTGPRG